MGEFNPNFIVVNVQSGGYAFSTWGEHAFSSPSSWVLWMAEFARRTVWAESYQVSFTHLLLSVSLFTAISVFAEALGEGDAIFCRGFLVNMEIHAIASIVTLSMLRPEMTCWHLC